MKHPGETRPPLWARAVVYLAAPRDRREEFLGDLYEAHRARRHRHGVIVSAVLTTLESVDVARAAVVTRGTGAARVSSRISWLDLKLGLRMLLKYPGLTAAGGLGLTVAIAIGVAFFSFLGEFVAPDVPLDGADRLLVVNQFDAQRNDEARRLHLHDLEEWRDEVSAIDGWAAYRAVRRSVEVDGGGALITRVVETTASSFDLARAPPHLGRPLTPADERPGAPPVVVIGHDVWQGMFSGAPDVVGRTVRIDGAPHDVVGVMPAGFAFPVNNRIWVPLRLRPGDFVRGRAPHLDVIGRLAPGATRDVALGQLATVTTRVADEYPDLYRSVRPRVTQFGIFVDAPQLLWLFQVARLLGSLLLVVIGTNVAVLVYARTASRSGEIAVRRALGASRARVTLQLFTEALVLSAGAAAAGLVAAGWLLGAIHGFLQRVAGEELPFWIDPSLSPATVGYALVLALVGAVLVGVVPALKATGGQVGEGLRAAGGRMSLGRTWTGLIVAQVAITVTVLPAALLGAHRLIQSAGSAPGFGSERMVHAWLSAGVDSMPHSDDAAARAAWATRFAELQGEVVRRLDAEPAVAGVTLSSSIPGVEPDHRWIVEAAENDGGASAGHRVGYNRVDPAFFSTFGMSPVVGRLLEPGDYEAPQPPVVVNRAFVAEALEGGNPLGRRIALLPEGGGDGVPREWREIVGVVPDFPVVPDPLFATPKVYGPYEPGSAHPVSVSTLVRDGSPEEFLGRFRDVMGAFAPSVRVDEGRPLDEMIRYSARAQSLVFGLMAVFAGSVLLLSAAGIYAMMAFTVNRRRREIGIRSALGAQPARVVGAVLRRAALQVAGGIAIGLLLGAGLAHAMGAEMNEPRSVLVLPVVVALMMGVGLAAAYGPVRRGLRVEPREALAAE